MNIDESVLLIATPATKAFQATNVLRVAQKLNIPYKRARWIVFGKWVDRGWWEYGVSWRCGWFTPEGAAEKSAVLGHGATTGS